MSLRHRGILVVAAAGLMACSPGLSFETGASTGASFVDAASSASGSGAAGPGSGGGSGSGGDSPSSPASSGSSGDGGAGSSTAQSAVSVSVVSTGTGADCVIADDCADSNPCTIDTCTPSGTCESVGVAPGEAGNAGEGSCPSGVCQADATCGLQIYSHGFGDGVGGTPAWERTTLSEAWGVTPNAPPFVGIDEVLYIRAQDLFFVFTDENLLYVRDGTGTWRPPVAPGAFFPEVGANIRCAYSFQSSSASTETSIILWGPGVQSFQEAWIYSLSPSGEASGEDDNPFPVVRAGEGGNPPPDDVACNYAFQVQTGYLGDPSWVIFWEGTGPNVYAADGGSSVWTAYGADTTSPLWNASGTGPASGDVVASWHQGNVLHMIAP